MNQTILLQMATHLGAALLAGSLIGIERSFNGRPAGFRTHALVCVASTLLMLVTTYQSLWLDPAALSGMQTDPTRMAQGIMTGIGFLGAGVIFKEGITVRGLTTAASIWMTAAIGTLLGIGFYIPAAMATVITLFTLSVFRILEGWMPSRYFVRGTVRVRRDHMLPESALRKLLERHGFSVSTVSYQLSAGGEVFEYHLLIRTIDRKHLRELCESLLKETQVLEFQLSAIGS